MSIKIIFAGTPDIACPALEALIQAPNCDVVAVYTQPDRPAGRGRKLTASAVKQLAEQNNIPVQQPENFKHASDVEKIKSYGADIMVVMAYGLLLPLEVINAAKIDCINLHVSQLPRWRGAAPIARAIWAGDKTTGVSLMRITEGLDCGPVYKMSAVDISATDTTATLSHKLALSAAEILIENIADIYAQNIEPIDQDDSLASYAKKINKQDGLIDWQQSAAEICLQIRACNPWPMTFSFIQGERVRIINATPQAVTAPAGEIVEISKHGLVVGCKDGSIQITELQLPGKKALAVADCYSALQRWSGEKFDDITT